MHSRTHTNYQTALQKSQASVRPAVCHSGEMIELFTAVKLQHKLLHQHHHFHHLAVTDETHI